MWVWVYVKKTGPVRLATARMGGEMPVQRAWLFGVSLFGVWCGAVKPSEMSPLHCPSITQCRSGYGSVPHTHLPARYLLL